MSSSSVPDALVGAVPPAGAGPQASNGLSLRIRLCYGAGSLFTSIYGTLPQVVLLYFMTSLLGVPPALAGVVVFLPKVLEIFYDPLLGLWSDGLRTPWGRRRPLMLAGTIVVGVCLPWLFNPPALGGPNATAFYMASLFMVCTVGYSLFFVPYLSMPAEMSEDAHEKTRLMSVRISFLSVGVLTAGAGAPWLVKAAGGGLAGYAVMGWCFTVLCVAAMTVAIFGTIGAPQTQASPHDLTLAEQLRLAWANKPFVILAAAYGLQVCAQGAFAAALPYHVQHVLGAGQPLVGLVFLCVTGTALLTMAPWAAAGRRLPKKSAYLIASAVYAAASLASWLHGGASDRTWVLAGFVLLGIGFGGMELFSHAMLPDATQHDRVRTGLNREALFSGLWIAVEKAGFAAGAAIVAALLHWGGLVASVAGGDPVVQPPAAVDAVRVAASWIPAGLFLVSLVVLSGYRLPEQSWDSH